MTGSAEDEPPDVELQQLVSRFIDQTLTEAERDRLEQRLREEPAAQHYCANAIRFEATLQEALNPQSLEWEETRKVVFDLKKGSPVLIEGRLSLEQWDDKATWQKRSKVVVVAEKVHFLWSAPEREAA